MTLTNVIGPLVQDESKTEAPPKWEATVAQVQKAIRAKVLESYRNGQAAGPRTAKQPQKVRRTWAEAPHQSNLE